MSTTDSVTITFTGPELLALHRLATDHASLSDDDEMTAFGKLDEGAKRLARIRAGFTQPGPPPADPFAGFPQDGGR